MRNITKILAVTIMMANINVYAGVMNFGDKVDHLRTISIDEDIRKKIEEYSNKYKAAAVEPKFCPFNSSGEKSLEKSLALLAKGFEGDCLGESNEFAKKLVNESMALETAIKDNPHVSSNTSMTSHLDQGKINTIFEGLDAALSFESCSDEKQKTLLSRSSSVLRSISQLGLYSVNPAAAAGSYGLLIASSALTFIDNLLTRGFSFDDKEDIKAFRELNCSYYDIRQKLKTINFFKRPTKEMEEDYEKIGGLLNNIDQEYFKTISSIKAEIQKEIQDGKVKHTSEIQKKILSLDHIILDLKKDLTKTTQIYETLDYLVLNFDSIKKIGYDGFIAPYPQYEKLSYANQNFQSLFDKISDISQTQKLSELNLEDYNDQFYTLIRNHFIRIKKDLEIRQISLHKEFEENSTITIEGDPYNIATLLELIKSTRIKGIHKEAKSLTAKLKKTHDELYSIVRRKVQSINDGFDNGDDNIIELHRKLGDYLYGNLGDDFIDAVNDQSTKTLKNYEKSYRALLETYFDKVGSNSIEDYGDQMIHNFCVESQNVIELAILGSIQIERAHDFFATNDSLIRQSKGRIIMSSPREDLYKNSLSALKARKIRKVIRTEYPSVFDTIDTMDDETIAQINSLQTSWRKARSVGENMLLATLSERQVKWLEKTRESYNCSTQYKIRFND